MNAAFRAPEAPELVAALQGRRLAVLTGAGLSTDSGIPDYRGPDSPPSNPMTIRQFTSDPVFRQRYWARNHLGWRHMDATAPNAGHRALAALEHAGVVAGVITQNVDLLHTKAGSQVVINLHGTYARVVCLDCGAGMTRAELAEQLEALNTGFAERAQSVGGIAVAPDADAMVADTESFRYLDCPRCGGMLKPDIVYFGENVAKDVVAQAYSLVEESDALLVAGSSLTVFSGYRFVRHAMARGMPVAIINRGPTRADDVATVKVEAGTSEMLALLASDLGALRRGDPLCQAGCESVRNQFWEGVCRLVRVSQPRRLSSSLPSITGNRGGRRVPGWPRGACPRTGCGGGSRRYSTVTSTGASFREKVV